MRNGTDRERTSTTNCFDLCSFNSRVLAKFITDSKMMDKLVPMPTGAVGAFNLCTTDWPPVAFMAIAASLKAMGGGSISFWIMECRQRPAGRYGLVKHWACKMCVKCAELAIVVFPCHIFYYFDRILPNLVNIEWTKMELDNIRELSFHVPK